MNYETILFDLDGTLTASAPGLIKSIRYALEGLGVTVEDEQELQRFIGPPVFETLGKFYGMDDAHCAKGVELFREYFNRQGWLENSVYPGIPELLRDLHAAGKTLMVATSKPTEQAVRVLEHFGLSRYLHRIEGASLDQTSCQKAAVICRALEKQPHGEPVVMVGDRENDCHGAAENGIPVIGALYGYGSREELESAGADQIAETVEDLRAILLGKN